MNDFNREMLILARESRGLTQTKLSEQSPFSQAEISKFETGLKIPTEQQVRALSSHLQYPEAFFYLTEALRDFGSGCVYHRRRQTASENKVRQLLALINIRRIQIKQLLKSVASRAEYQFEPLDIDEHGNPALVAQRLKAIWKVPPGPVQSVIRLIENAGGIIIKSDFGTDKVDALSQWLAGMPPIFMINERIPIDRLRFTLMHEVGHITMHRFPTETMEREADAFAAEFLMPERDIKPELLNLSIVRLAALKPRWRVSMNALLKRAGDLETIAPRTKSYLWMQMGQRGYRTHEPVPLPTEEPTLLKELIEVHKGVLGYGPEELAKTMYLDRPELFTEYMGEAGGFTAGSGLRLVK